MANAFSSTVIDAGIESVWRTVRDFNGMPGWHPAIADSTVEDGRAADSVGAVRSFHLASGAHVRERLLALSDAHWTFTYNFELEAFPVDDYRATLRLLPVTDAETGDGAARTFASWSAAFTERPGSTTDHGRLIADAVFATGLAALKAKAEAAEPSTPPVVWRAGRPAKVFCSAVIGAPPAKVWERVRDFAGMGGWHDGITAMAMEGGRRADEVGAVRDFRFGEARLREELLWLSDQDHAFGYRILDSPRPWLNYRAWLQLHPITDGGRSLGVWQADWTAAVEDDLTMVADVHRNVFLHAFRTLDRQAGGGLG